ncbi:MAG: UDP-N-acetylmuramate--L-alanine ligase [Bacteroidetes bacterium]|nr:UDP-N-acetylmuramate--L-alanine ligase [Bacteroidota bacterium]
MQLDKIKNVYFVGIGGIGMSALARYFNLQGAKVSGYDRTPTNLTDQLQKEGILIHFEDNIELIDKDAELVIYTPAIPKNHKELNYIISNNYPLYKRSEVLGMLSRDKFTIAVSGSHGKTTVSGMITWILKNSGYDCTAFLGGICSNFNSNFVHGENDVMVAEADEYDRSFMRLFPNITVVTAVDSDHLEIYGTQAEVEKAFIEFANKTEIGGEIIIKAGLPIIPFLEQHVTQYALENKEADLWVSNYKITLTGSEVELSNGIRYTLKYPGIHNIENSVAAVAVALQLGITNENISESLNTFQGIYRRFELVASNNKTVYIDDYAHHPEEIRMFLLSLRAIYKDKKITAIFQPHLFTRTRDLADGFAASLDLADEIILMPIYPAREEPIEGVTSDIILSRIKNPRKRILNKEELLHHINENEFEILCTIGAGDIDKMIKPIAEIINTRS